MTDTLFSAFLSFLQLPASYTINHALSDATSFGGMLIQNHSVDSESFNIEINTRIYYQDIGPVEYDYAFKEDDIFFTKAFLEHLWIKGSFQTESWKASFMDFVPLNGDRDCASIRVESFETGQVAGLIVCFGGELEIRRITIMERVHKEDRQITFDLRRNFNER